MPAIQPLQTAIGAHPNHDAIATAKIIRNRRAPIRLSMEFWQGTIVLLCAAGKALRLDNYQKHKARYCPNSPDSLCL
jgi:hypothetical protein